jgi:hypothetical protein
MDRRKEGELAAWSSRPASTWCRRASADPHERVELPGEEHAGRAFSSGSQIDQDEVKIAPCSSPGRPARPRSAPRSGVVERALMHLRQVRLASSTTSPSMSTMTARVMERYRRISGVWRLRRRRSPGRCGRRFGRQEARVDQRLVVDEPSPWLDWMRPSSTRSCHTTPSGGSRRAETSSGPPRSSSRWHAYAPRRWSWSR